MPSLNAMPARAACKPPVDPNPLRRDLLALGGLALVAPAALIGCREGGGGSAAAADGPLAYDATIADARAAIRKAMAASATPSVSVALIERDRLAWAEAFGSIDQAAGTPATTDTLYCIGSCSKVIATIAVMLLVERGRVDLDAPLVRYLPGFTMASPDYVRITVRMLVDHSSGLPGAEYRGLFGSAPNPDYVAQVLRTLAGARLKHAPGEMSVYCNDGFTLVEPLVAAVTGTPYPQFVAREILGPLGMVRSRYAQAPLAEGTYAPGYAGNVRLPQEFTAAHASGGLYTTPSEMARVARMLLNGGEIDGVRLLQAASVAEMGRNQTLAQPRQPVPMSDGFGLGWDGVKADALAVVGVTAWHKAGGTEIYGSDFFVAPDEGLAVMITGASTAYGAGALAERILLSALVERGRIPALPAPVPEVAAPRAPVTDADVAAMEGVYASYQGLVRFEAAAGRTLTKTSYTAGSWQPPETGLALRTDGWFASDANPLYAYRRADAAGEAYVALRFPYGMGHYLWEVPAAQRLLPKAPLSPAWRARIGRRWLVVNEPATSSMHGLYLPFLALAAVPELPGYVLVTAGPLDGKHDQVADASTGDDVARMCLRIPMAFGRDLDDLVIERRGDEEWVHDGSTVFRPEASVPRLARGANAVAIGAEGYAEWRALTGPGVLATTGAADWKLFAADGALQGSGRDDAAGQPAPAGALLLVYGAPGAVITVDVH